VIRADAMCSNGFKVGGARLGRGKVTGGQRQPTGYSRSAERASQRQRSVVVAVVAVRPGT
jgi:hypothetical protein